MSIDYLECLTIGRYCKIIGFFGFIQFCAKYKYINFIWNWELCQKGFPHKSRYYKVQLYNFKIKSYILYELLFFKLFGSCFAFERMNFNIFLFTIFVFSDCNLLKISKAEDLVLHSLRLWLKIYNWFWKHALNFRWFIYKSTQ